MVHLRSPFITRYCSVVQTKFSSNKRHFADGAKVQKLYETLGVSSTASHNEIKKAYYDLTLKYHPDRNEDNEEAAVKFREVTEAYEILGNFSLRMKYDKGIPISRVKQAVRPTVKHKAKFQEFLDSRFTDEKTSSDARSKEIHDLSKFTKIDKEKLGESEIADDKRASTVKLQNLCAVIIFIAFMLLR